MIHDPRNFEMPLEVQPFLTLPPFSAIHAVRHAADLLAHDSSVPALIPVRGLQDVIALRLRQISEFGHTPARDLERPIDALPKAAQVTLAKAELQGGREYAQFGKPEIARRYLVKACALILAAIDRIDHQPTEEVI